MWTVKTVIFYSSTRQHTPMPTRRDTSYRLPPITLLTILFEFAVILAAAFFATRNMHNMSPNLQWTGPDLPLLTHSAAFASRIFQETGAIPLWNPFIGNGEPMLESIQSFILNPFMFAPILLLGPVVGSKVGILLHIVMMGLGGWTLGRMLGLRWAGRIMLGVFLLGSGSMAGQMGRGLYQLTLSQAYTPWIFAGLIGTLYTSRRWCVALLAVATTMLVFAGTFWYVLPTAISCALLTVVTLVRKGEHLLEFKINWHIVRQLVIAALFMAGLCAIRLLPLNRDLLFHPIHSQDLEVSFQTKFSTYFFPITVTADGLDSWMNFHYVVPSLFAIIIVLAVVVLYASGYRREAFGPPLLRILIPAVLIIILFTLWGQGTTEFLEWLYEQIPFLSDWRNPGRIAAAASIWVVVLAAIGFDTISQYLSQSLRRGEMLFQGFQLPDKSRLFAVSSRPLIAVLLIGGVLAASDVLNNWDRYNELFNQRTEHSFRGEVDGLAYLRNRIPDAMLVVQTEGWVSHYGFVETLSRAMFGDHDVFTMGMPSTIAAGNPMDYYGNFVVLTNYNYLYGIERNGFIPFMDAPLVDNQISTWYHPNVPAYAFLVSRTRLLTDNGERLKGEETQPVTYYHHINSVDVVVDDYPPDSVLVVNETNYPGWVVTVNGEPAILESAGGRLGILLPTIDVPGEPLYVTFSYQPQLLRIGALILIATVIVFSGYALRLDQRIQIPEPVRRYLNPLVDKAVHTLLTPGALEEYSAAQPPVPLLNPPVRVHTDADDSSADNLQDRQQPAEEIH